MILLGGGGILDADGTRFVGPIKTTISAPVLIRVFTFGEITPMSERRYETFAEFWPFYVSEHSVPACRALHFIGSTLSLVIVSAAILYNPWLLIATPLVG